MAAPTPAGSASLTGQSVRLRDPNGSDCINVRSEPKLTATVEHCLPSGTLAKVLDGPRTADGHQWWNLDAGGWSAQDFLLAAGGAPSASSLLNAAVIPAPSPDLSIASALARALANPTGQSPLSGYSGWATYYGIEDGFMRGDVMNDGTPYDPANPTIAAASLRIPLHTWLRVCTTFRCILVQARDRGLLDQNGILLDLSRAAYALLFGGLGGKQWISAYYVDPTAVSLAATLAGGLP